jgi:hypothetical protein
VFFIFELQQQVKVELENPTLSCSTQRKGKSMKTTSKHHIPVSNET